MSRPSPRARGVLAALALLAAFPACQVRDLPPDAAYRALVRAVADRDEAAAWELLSSATQARLVARARTAAAEAPGVVSPEARSLLAGDAALSVLPPRAITVLEAGADRAVLRVEAPAAETRDVVVVRERGGWRIDLPGQ